MKQGNFNFNTGAMKLLKDKAVTHLQLMYDKDTNRIAFKPCSKETAGAYALRSVKGGGQVSGSAFLKNYGIDHSQTRSCPATWQDGLLIISLTLGS
jgi:hypothetical protein